MANVEIVEKVSNLMALARTEEKGEPTEEARNAAVQACKLIEQNELVVVRKGDLEQAAKAVEGARAIRKAAQKEKREGMLLGGAIGLMLGRGGFFK